MRVHITFDVEIWCPGWTELDASFPATFDRYVWGRSAYGEFALPKNLEILRAHGLTAVFFVEPLFSLRFGFEHLCTITTLIQNAGQDVQLHLHPEWVDEIQPPLLIGISCKRQHLTDFSVLEQTTLLTRGKALVEAATGRPVTAFRSGGYSVNRDSYRALAASQLWVDSSLNVTFDRTGGSLGDAWSLRRPQVIEGVQSHPVTVFRDGTGRDRHCQIGACSFQELRDVLESAFEQGHEEVVLVSHNFELLKQKSHLPDRVVPGRFEALCAYLAAHPSQYQVVPFAQNSLAGAPVNVATQPPRSRLWSTGLRYAEQAFRRVG